MDTPNGLPAIIATFGDVHAFVDDTGVLTPQWQNEHLSTSALPFPLALSWNPNVKVSKITCHRLLVETFEQVFAEIVRQGLSDSVVTFGGCFNFRQEKASVKLSTHAWGIAIDLNPESNAQGTPGNMDHGVVEIFDNAGFEWGGNWPEPRTDAMHFQFCSGY